MKLEITGFGEKLMERDLLRFQHNLEAPIIALQDVATLMRAFTERQFDSQGGNSGGWAPLKASTVAEKARKGEDPRILHATGKLRESLTRKFDPAHVETLSANSLRFGSTVAYGAFHQTGTRKMPKRAPLALSASEKIEIVKVIQKSLLAGVHG